jgi:hypothetical protein
VAYRQDDDVCLWEQGEDALRRVDTTQLRQHQVHDDYFWKESHRGRHGFLAVGDGLDDSEIRVSFENGRNAIPYDAVIVNNQDSDKRNQG